MIKIKINGLSERTWTSNLHSPNVVAYQISLHLDKEFLKFQIASNDEIGNADVKEVINKFIGRTGIGFTITNEIES